MSDDATTTPVRLVHVGLGNWGLDWEANAVPPVAEVERVAVVDGHAPTLRAAQERLGLPDDRCFSSLAEAFAAVDAEAVLVTAPMVAHVPLAIEALDAGKHVLVEKPFAGTVAEARTAVELAEERGLVLQVSQNYRFRPAAQAARRLVAEGAVGELSVVHADFRRWDHDAAVGDSRHYAFPHPLLYDMAIHHFDLLRMVTGRDAVSVYAKVTDPSWSKYEEEAAAVVVVELEGGLVASYRGSWVSQAPQTTWDGEWSVEGRDGRITFTGRGATLEEEQVELRVGHGPDRGALEPVELPAPGLVGRAAGLQQLARAVRGGPPPEVTGRSNLASVALMEAAVRSAASGRVEDVEQVLPAEVLS
ncbi:Gfo/Idh/MocA family oxidoreductase [Pseudokineococcus basanitobsidens]|uniref:Gfo/Idh/MocA family oxidoreductase n=1 Tax=Pseudokineococcus basanitobsidens TaxID=1926649 RepID=A0ABU8RMV9_9ACTN